MPSDRRGSGDSKYVAWVNSDVFFFGKQFWPLKGDNLINSLFGFTLLCAHTSVFFFGLRLKLFGFWLLGKILILIF